MGAGECFCTGRRQYSRSYFRFNRRRAACSDNMTENRLPRNSLKGFQTVSEESGRLGIGSYPGCPELWLGPE